MYYYLGADFSNSYFHDALLNTGGTGNVLFSYASESNPLKAIQTLKKFEAFNIIVDSGAFSVWNTGRTIDRNDLLAYYKALQAYRPDIHCINLDVIPGVKGRKPTAKQASEACAKGWKNYLWFKSNGINPLPVFHEDDDFMYLELMKNETDYIAIIPANDSHVKKRIVWLDQVYGSLRGDYKTHGLAATSIKLLERYPFYSVDSINWKAPLMYGRSEIPHSDHIKYLARDKTAKHSVLYNEIRFYKEQQDYITKLWEKRGIKF